MIKLHASGGKLCEVIAPSDMATCMSATTCLWLLLVASCMATSSFCCCSNLTVSVHYITPDYNSATCLGQPCFTLNDYVRQSSVEPFSSDTTVVFQSGRHYFNASEHVVIRDTRNLTINGTEPPVVVGNSTVSGSEIICVDRSGFIFCV